MEEKIVDQQRKKPPVLCIEVYMQIQAMFYRANCWAETQRGPEKTGQNKKRKGGEKQQYSGKD